VLPRRAGLGYIRSDRSVQNGHVREAWELAVASCAATVAGIHAVIAGREP
jgi:hypothetical protein